MCAQVVAPVRETAAQALGAAVQPLPVSQAQALLSLLHQLIQQQQWDVRHGGLLGLKYLLAARTDASQELMPRALPAAILGLQVTLWPWLMPAASATQQSSRWLGKIAGFRAGPGHFAVKAVDKKLADTAVSDMACIAQSLLQHSLVVDCQTDCNGWYRTTVMMCAL